MDQFINAILSVIKDAPNGLCKITKILSIYTNFKQFDLMWIHIMGGQIQGKGNPIM